MKSVSTFVSHSVRTTNTTMRAVATTLLLVFVVVIVLPDTGVSVVDGVLFQDHNGPHVPDRIVFGKPGGLLQRSTTAPISSSTTSAAAAAVDATSIPPGFEANIVPRTPPSVATKTQQAPPQKTTTLPVASAVAPTTTAAASTPPAPAPTHVHDGCRLLPSTDGTLMYECSPSSTPSAAPTDVPSVSPSTTPTLSSQPSLSPSRSVQPSESPSVSPSAGPSASPSVSPTDVPSVSPSMSPSYSPTPVSQKMKSAMTSLLLEDIATDMDMVTAAEFELLTVAFLQKKIASTETYTLATLAVNVVSQTRITNSVAAEAEDSTAAAVDKNDANTNTDAFNLSPDHTPNGTRRHVRRGRQLEKETWTVALVVDIRTVGEVTEGRVPKTFNYTKEVDYAFYDHWDQYLWQLGTTIPFFEPLIDVSDYVPQTREEVIIDQKYNRKKKNNGAFAFGILFSLVAFGLAMFASYLAIRKHMKNGEGYDVGGASIFRKQYKNVTTPAAAAGKGKNRRKSGGVRVSPKHSPPGYSGPEVINYLTKTRTMSDDDNSYHDGRAEGGGAIAFVNNIDVDKHCHLENIALTPRRSSSPTHNNINVARDGLFVVDEESGDDESCSKKSSKNKIKNAHQESSSSPMTGLGGQLRNWLSPKGKSLMSTIRNTTTAMGGEDRGPYHQDPPTTAAAKAKAVVTQASPAPAAAADLSPTGGGPEGGFTLPISFFSNHRSSDGNNGDDESPMSSLADSNASSFFAIGNMNKTFAGRRSSAENNAVHSGAVEASSYSNENHHHAGSIAAAASVHSIMRTKNSDTNNSKQRTTGGHTHQHITVPSIMHTQSSDSETSAVQRLKAQFEGKHNQTQPHYHYQQQPEPKPLREIQNTTNNEYENSLVGAVSRASQEEGQEIQYNPSFGSARSIFSPQKSGQSNDRSTPFGFGGNSNRGGGQQLETAKSEASTSTLGARPMDRTANSNNSSVANNDDDSKSTLAMVMNSSESYDVYAPSGPIGVVVDTSHKGPAVHSLKATSPMLGLITPGDLIIALDGEDTRKMSAAALTRLMAKKSRQRERKITLFSGDGF